MPCNTLVEPACRAVHGLVGSLTGSVTSDILGSIAQAVTAGIRWVVQNTAAWWVQIPSPSLGSEPAVTHIQQWLLPVTAAVAVGGVTAAGLRMALTRRANPLLDVTGGLLTLSVATALGATIATLLLKAGDAWSSWVLQASTGGHFTQRMIEALDLGGKAAPAVVLICGVIAIVLGLVQAVLMLFRQAALIILAGALPLAAAGSVAPMTRTWLRKVTAWMLALICYKPAAAAVFATAFTMIGTGRSPRTAVMGFVMLALSIIALPALMRFFTWTTGTIAQTGGGGGGFLGTAAMGAVAIGAMRGGGGQAAAAQDQAAYLGSRLGPPPAGGGTPGSPPPPSGPGGPASPGPAASTTSASPASAAPSAGTPYSSRTGSAAAGAASPSTITSPARSAESASVAAGSAPAGPAAAGAGPGGGAATGAATAAGPAGAAAATAAGAARAVKRGTHLATGAMDPGDDQ